MRTIARIAGAGIAGLLLAGSLAADDIQDLVAALLGPTPLAADLAALTDGIGGRPTGSEANLRAVTWGEETLRAAGVAVRREAFTMPAAWDERSASATVEGEGVAFSPPVAAMPFSTGTPAAGSKAPLVDGGAGSDEDFARLGEAARGAFVLVETEELLDIPGLFREYTEAAQIEGRAFAAGVAGVVYQGSRARDVLYRHNASLGPDNRHPLLIMDRDGAGRALRLLRAGRALELTVRLDIAAGGPYESYNVVAEIPGAAARGEVVLIGAHLDSWGIGTGALDNGCNVALVIDLARQIARLGLKPRRTIRLVLWNGEEQGMIGSWGYVQRHRDELDGHVMAISIDIGSGRLEGFFTGGRPDVVAWVDRLLEPVAGLGPFVQVDVPVVGTDNYDFMMEGIPNLVGNQASANYGPNYHARSDTFDKVDLQQVRLNAAVAAAVVWGFANADVELPRQSRAEIQALIDSTELGQDMRTFHFMEAWESGERGRE